MHDTAAMGIWRRVGRPMLGYGAAVLAAASVLALCFTLLDGLGGSLPAAVQGAMYLTVLISYGILLFASIPALLITWLAHATGAPRPLTDTLAGAALGPGIMLVVSSGRISPSDWQLYPMLALAGALGGLVYGLIAGRPAPRLQR